MLVKSLFVKIALALGRLVRRSLSLIDLEGSFTLSWCLSSDKSCSVLLELGTLRFDFKFIVAVEGCSIFAVHATFGVDCRSSLCLSFGLNFEPSLTFVHTVESLLVGSED